MLIHLFALASEHAQFFYVDLCVRVSERLLGLVALLTFKSLVTYLTHFERLLSGTNNDLFNESFQTTSEL
jgi:hypothetical protein